MNRGNSYTDKHFDFILMDELCIIISFLLSVLIGGHKFSGATISGVLVLIMADAVAIFLTEPYKNVLRQSNERMLKLSFTSSFVATITAETVFYFFNLFNTYFDRMLIGTFFLHAILCFLVGSSLRDRIIKKQAELRTYVICESKHLKNINTDGICGICVIDKNRKGEKYDGIIIDANKDNLFNKLNEEWVDVVRLYVDDIEKHKDLLDKLIKNGIVVKIKLPEIVGRYMLEKDMLVGTCKIISNRYLFVKRVFDICCGIMGLVVLAPLSLIVKIINLLHGDKASIFYRQKRIGQNFKEINILKYRSMVPDADQKLQEMLLDPVYKEEWDKNQKFENDPRITKIGKFLRKTSLDELPQLINVLKGDMSLIGPRPLVPSELEQHDGLRMYCVMKPGITGWWGCNGRSDVSYEERLNMEYYYIKNCSAWLDIKIIFKTIAVVLQKKGAK